MNDAEPRSWVILKEALDIADAGEREAYLAAACGGDATLRAKVEALLTSQVSETRAGSGDFPVARPEDRTGKSGEPADREVRPTLNLFASELEGPGSVIGNYRLIEVLGEGGFGSVYRADQSEPVRREVALKILKLGMATREVMARFEAERQALALMDHPNIARVYDAGATATGRPYFVMELVTGEPLTAFCDRQRMPLRQRLELFLQVCAGVQHAHQKGLIHRDLKPGNILVTEVDGAPVPKVIDFGIAKALEQKLTAETLQTLEGQLIGTPVYMSPEQAMGSGDIDTRSDVYALGVVLHELLTGLLPIDREALQRSGVAGAMRLIRDTVIVRPSTKVAKLGAAEAAKLAERRGVAANRFARELSGELDWVVLKALEKDRERRYAAASAVAADVQRYLAEETVAARPPTLGYQVRVFARRHKALVTGTVAVFAALVAGLAGMAVLYGRAERERRDKENALTEVMAANKLAEEKRLEAVAAQRRAEEEAAIAQAVNEFINKDVLAQADPSIEPDPDVKVKDVIYRAAASVEGRFTNAPVIEASVRTTIGAAFVGLGEYNEARAHLERAVQIFKAERGDHDLATLKAQITLARAYGRLSMKKEAAAMALQVLPLVQKLRGSDDPQALTALRYAGNFAGVGGQYALAEQYSKEAYDGMVKLRGEDDREAIETRTELAHTYLRMGRLDEAERLQKDALERQTRVASEKHHYTLYAMQNLANIYEKQGRTNEAEQLVRRLLTLRTETQGPDHPETLVVMQMLGGMLRKQGDFAAAEPLLRKAVEGNIQRVGPAHERTLSPMNTLAYLLRQTGRHEEAISWYEKIIEAMAVNPQQQINVFNPADVMANLARSYADLGQPEKGIAIARRAYETYQQQRGSNDGLTLQAGGLLGSLLLNAKQYEESEKVYREVIQRRRQNGQTDEELRGLIAGFTGALINQGWMSRGKRDYERSEKVLLEACELRLRVFGAEADQTRTAIENLIKTYEAWKKPEKAAEWQAKQTSK